MYKKITTAILAIATIFSLSITSSAYKYNTGEDETKQEEQDKTPTNINDEILKFKPIETIDYGDVVLEIYGNDVIENMNGIKPFKDNADNFKFSDEHINPSNITISDIKQDVKRTIYYRFNINVLTNFSHEKIFSVRNDDWYPEAFNLGNADYIGHRRVFYIVEDKMEGRYNTFSKPYVFAYYAKLPAPTIETTSRDYSSITLNIKPVSTENILEEPYAKFEIYTSPAEKNNYSLHSTHEVENSYYSMLYGTDVTIDGLDNNTKYDIKVKAISKDHIVSDFSNKVATNTRNSKEAISKLKSNVKSREASIKSLLAKYPTAQDEYDKIQVNLNNALDNNAEATLFLNQIKKGIKSDYYKSQYKNQLKTSVKLIKKYEKQLAEIKKKYKKLFDAQEKLEVTENKLAAKLN